MGAERGHAAVAGERSARPGWPEEEPGFGPPLIGIYFLFGTCWLGGVWGIAEFGGKKSPRAFGQSSGPPPEEMSVLGGPPPDVAC